MAAIQGAAGVQPRGPEAVKVEDVKAGSGKVKGTLTLSWAPATNDATPPIPYPTYRITNTPKGCVFNGSTPDGPGFVRISFAGAPYRAGVSCACNNAKPYTFHVATRRVDDYSKHSTPTQSQPVIVPCNK